MKFELRHAFRSLLSGKGGLLRLSTAAAILGIGFGVASLIVVQAIYNGFRTGIEKGLLDQTAHITVTAEDGDIASGNVIKGAIARTDGVERVEPIIFKSGVVGHEGKTSYGLVKVALGPDRDRVQLGSGLAKKLDIAVGSKIELLLPGPNRGPINGELVVTGTIDTGIYEYNSSLISISSDRYSELNPGGLLLPNAYLVQVDDPFQADHVGSKIRSRIGGGHAVVDWMTANRPLFSALRAERRIAAAVFLLMIGVSALGVAATLVLLANERRFDLAVMKTCGATARSLALIYLIEGSVIGVLGVILGVGLGLITCLVANNTGFVVLSPEVYSIANLELDPDTWSVTGISVGAMVITLAAVLIPVIRVSRIRPSEIFRSL